MIAPQRGESQSEEDSGAPYEGDFCYSKCMQTSSIHISTNDKIALMSNLATMLKAGISIIDAIDSLLEDSKGSQKILLQTIKEDINQGIHLHESLAKFPQIFNKVSLNIVHASEEAGTLDSTLRELAENYRKQQEFMDHVRGAFTYPVMILFVFTAVFTLILTFVVPRIATVFERMNTDLPLPTVFLIELSRFVLAYYVPLLAGFLVCIVFFALWYRTNRQMVFSVLFSLPLISRLMRQIDITNFTRNMYMLLSAGIPIVSALELMEDVMYKHEMRQVVRGIREQVLAGRAFSVGLREHKSIIPTLVIRMVEAGEKSGTLDESMSEIADHLDREVSRSLETATTLIEPIMLVIVGVMIGGMMLSIIAPIYGLIGNFRTR